MDDINNITNILSPLQFSAISFMKKQDHYHYCRLNCYEFCDLYLDEYNDMQDAENKLRQVILWPTKGPDLRLLKLIKDVLYKQNTFFAFRHQAIKMNYDVKKIGIVVFKEWVEASNKARKKLGLSKLELTLAEIDDIYR
jgi:hypothetical protein